jgi:hypothetical protein
MTEEVDKRQGDAREADSAEIANRETLLGVLAERARQSNPRRLAIAALLSVAAAGGVVASGRTWWPLAMVLLAAAAYCAWGLAAQRARARADGEASRRGRVVAGVQLAAAAIGSVAAVLAVVGAFVAAFTGTSTGVKGSAQCYFNGQWRYSDRCPRLASPAAPADLVYAAVIDSLYFGLARTKPGVAQELVLLQAQTSSGSEIFAADVLPRLLRSGAVRDAGVPTDALLSAFRAASARPTELEVLPTVAAVQELLNSAEVRELLSSPALRDTAVRGRAPPARSATDRRYAGALGVLALSPVAFDSTGTWALVFASVRAPAGSETGRLLAASYVLLRRERHGWRVWQELSSPLDARM